MLIENNRKKITNKIMLKKTNKLCVAIYEQIVGVITEPIDFLRFQGFSIDCLYLFEQTALQSY